MQTITDVIKEVAEWIPKKKLALIASDMENKRKNVLENVTKFQKTNITDHTTAIEGVIKPTQVLQLCPMPRKFDEIEVDVHSHAIEDVPPH